MAHGQSAALKPEGNKVLLQCCCNKVLLRPASAVVIRCYCIQCCLYIPIHSYAATCVWHYSVGAALGYVMNYVGATANAQTLSRSATAESSDGLTVQATTFIVRSMAHGSEP